VVARLRVLAVGGFSRARSVVTLLVSMWVAIYRDRSRIVGPRTRRRRVLGSQGVWGQRAPGLRRFLRRLLRRSLRRRNPRPGVLRRPARGFSDDPPGGSPTTRPGVLSARVRTRPGLLSRRWHVFREVPDGGSLAGELLGDAVGRLVPLVGHVNPPIASFTEDLP
jgi:hypothetical protein